MHMANIVRVFVLVLGFVSVLPAAAEYQWGRSESIARGISVSQCVTEAPRKMRIIAVKVDLKTPNLAFTGTGRAPAADYGKPLDEAKTLYNSKGVKVEPAEKRTVRKTVAAFFVNSSMASEKGGRGLDMLVAFNSCQTQPPYSGSFADPRGLVISDGEIVADHPHGRSPLFVVRKNGDVDIVENVVAAEYGDIQLAHSGYALIRKGGADVIAPDRIDAACRLAVGLTPNKKTLYIVSVDDGATGKRGTGANHHDLNDIFADLGCSDAMVTESAPASAIVVKDKEQDYRILNRLPGQPDPGVVPAAIGIYLADRKAQAAAAKPASKAQITVKWSQTPRLNAFREKKPAETVLKGQIRAKISSDLPRFKRPVVSVSALFDVNGMWRHYDTLLTDPGTHGGGCLDVPYTLAQVSGWQPEVTASAWTQPVFGNPKIGFFRGFGVSADSKAKLVAYRIEVWQNGELVSAYDSDKNAIKKIGAPEDWYVKGKYKGKITYRWPPKPAAK